MPVEQAFSPALLQGTPRESLIWVVPDAFGKGRGPVARD